MKRKFKPKKKVNYKRNKNPLIKQKGYKKITEFQGEYRWLSNFVDAEITLNGNTFKSVEHGYVHGKFTDPKLKEKCVNPTNLTSGDIKRLGRKAKLPKDWNSRKLQLMRSLLELKFQIPEYKEKLLATGDMVIEEGNRWGDKFWGIDLRTGEGNNNLGRMIMEIRDNLRDSERNSSSFDDIL